MDNYSAVAPPQTNNPVDSQTAFADAVARARQIAAKIHQSAPPQQQQPPQPQTPPDLLGPQGLKRPYDEPLDLGHQHEGSPRGPMEPRRYGGPDAKKIAAINDPIGAQIRAMQEQQRTHPAAQAAQAAAMQINQKIRAQPPSNSILTETFLIPDRMVGLVIGKSGETITKLQAESDCKVQIAQEQTGPERPCTLQGTAQSILRAKQLIQETLETGRSAGSAVGENETQVEMLIPGTKVGLIIGKGGETIKQLQEKAQVRMVMIQDSKEPTCVQKPLRITGDPMRCQRAKEMVMDLLAEKEMENDEMRPQVGRIYSDSEYKDKANSIHRIPDVFQSMQSGPFGGGGGRGNDFGGGGGGKQQAKEEIKVPKNVVGQVIGRGGETIKEIQQETNTRVQFQKDDPDDHNIHERGCLVSGSPEAVRKAIDKIYQVINEKQNSQGRGRGDRGGGGGGGGGMGRFGDPDIKRGGPDTFCSTSDETHFPVPSDKCGLVIGKGGENIRNIMKISGAFVELMKNTPPGATQKTFIIRGQPKEVEEAISHICNKAGIPPPPPGGPPGGPGGPGGPGMGGPGMGGPAGPGGPPGGYDQMGQHNHQQPPQHPQQPPQQQSGPPSYAPQGWQNAYPSNWGGGGGGGQQQSQPPPPHQQNQQPPQSGSSSGGEQAFNPVTGQRDYSAAWAEYYRMQGWGDYIDLIFNQAQGRGGGQSGGPGGGPPSGGPPSGGPPSQPTPPSSGPPGPSSAPQPPAPSQYGQQPMYTSYPGYNAQQNQGQYGNQSQQYGQYGQYGQ